ncbi:MULTISPECIES: hypothetical protein [Saccharothrix]|uniref:hypothetical protein n=1 Tax=Saccharothrix TaxID=2071 RepID=UPI0011614B68|nr:hypothetical protein [Saccharothrix sp. CB00851]
MSNLKKEVLAACTAGLRELGFTKQDGKLILDRGDGASGWLGLNLATFALPASLMVNPVVGVRFASVEDIMLTIRDDIPRTPMPVVSRPLGYLMPERTFRTWEFQRDGNIEQVAASLVSAVKQYGIPYIDTYADWRVFCHSVELPGFLLPHEKAKVIPVVPALNKQLDEAREVVRTELTAVADSDGVYAQSYRDFAEKLFSCDLFTKGKEA